MTKHDVYNQHYGRPPPSPLELPFTTLLGDGDECFSRCFESTEMEPSCSQYSLESGWGSSPQSYNGSYLNSHQFPQACVDVSPVMPLAVTFDASASCGTWTDDPGFDNLPMVLSEHDLQFDSSLMFHVDGDAGYPPDNSDFSGSFESSGGYEAPPEASKEASSSYICPQPTPSAQKLTTSSTRHGYKCQVPGCDSKTRFTRKTDLTRHVKSRHSGDRFNCEFTWCGRSGENGFVRKDHYLEHLREMHKKPIPKIHKKRSKR